MHECPECGQACGCSGDIEDHDTGGEFYEDCCHECGPEPGFEWDDGGHGITEKCQRCMELDELYDMEDEKAAREVHGEFAYE